MQVHGLYGQIQDNNKRAALLLFCLFVLFLYAPLAFMMLYTAKLSSITNQISLTGAPDFWAVFSQVMGNSEIWTYSLIWCFIGFTWLLWGLWQYKMQIRRETRARPVTRCECPELYNTVENLAISVGLPCPSIEIIPSHSLNSYATGLSRESATIALTQGLIENLTVEELETVIAHELSHIENGDARFIAIAKISADIAMMPILGAPDQQTRKKLIGAGIVFVFLGLGISLPLLLILALIPLALLLLVWLSKNLITQTRDFIADTRAVELTKNPEALISALSKTSQNNHIELESPVARSMLFTDQKEHWFHTQPTIRERIQELSRLVNKGFVQAPSRSPGFGAPSIERNVPPPLATGGFGKQPAVQKNAFAPRTKAQQSIRLPQNIHDNRQLDASQQYDPTKERSLLMRFILPGPGDEELMREMMPITIVLAIFILLLLSLIL